MLKDDSNAVELLGQLPEEVGLVEEVSVCISLASGLTTVEHKDGAAWFVVLLVDPEPMLVGARLVALVVNWHLNPAVSLESIYIRPQQKRGLPTSTVSAWGLPNLGLSITALKCPGSKARSEL